MFNWTNYFIAGLSLFIVIMFDKTAREDWLCFAWWQKLDTFATTTILYPLVIILYLLDR